MIAARHKDAEVVVPSLFAILVAVLAIPSKVLVASSFDGYSSLVALFLGEVRRQILPSGWITTYATSGELRYVYVVASLLVTLLLGSPLIAYLVLKRILPASVYAKEKKASILTALSICLLACGVVLGFHFAPGFLSQSISVSPQNQGFFPPSIDAAVFFFTIFKSVTLMALSLTIPAYIAIIMLLRKKA